MFDWCFGRTMAGCRPDLIEVRESDKLIAGSALTYRKVRLPTGEVVRAAIMTGSFTMPSARGRGIFSSMIGRSLALAKKRDCPMLLAFVTEANASRVLLEKAGADLVPSFYCRRASGPITVTSLLPEQPAATCVYTDEEWVSQFIDRPERAVLYEEDGYKAVIDAAKRLHWLRGDPGVIQGADVQFMFTTDRRRIPGGFDVIPGSLAVLGEARPKQWSLENGDRM